MEFMLGCALILLIIILINICSVKSKQNKDSKYLETLQEKISSLEKTFTALLKTREKPDISDKASENKEDFPTETKEAIKIHPAYATKTPEQATQKSATVSSASFEKTEALPVQETPPLTTEALGSKPIKEEIIEDKITEPYEPRVPSDFENKINAASERVQEILQKSWNWIIVGEEFRNPKFSMEYAVASAWLLRVTIIIFLLGGIFIANYAMEKGILGPIPRVMGILLIGVVLLVGGIKLAFTKYHPISQGLLGAGIGFLYIGIYTGFAQYHIIPYLFAFGLMFVVTLVAGYISVKLNSMLTAIFGVVGGYVTPLLVTGSTPSLISFYSYVLILTIAILVIAKFKDWKILNALAFIFTYALFFYSVSKIRTCPPKDFITILSFFSAYFVLFSLIPIVYNIFNKIKATYIELIFMFLNATMFFCKSYELITNNFDRQYAAILTVALALFFVIQIYIFLRKNIIDKKLLVFFAGVAAFFLIFTIPVLLSGKMITTAWALMALIFVWMSKKLKCNILRIIAYILYGLTIGRLITCDFYDNFISNASFNNYWKYMLGRVLTFGTTIASFACSSYILKKNINDNNEYTKVMEKNNIVKDNEIPGILTLFFWLVFVAIFLYSQFEIYHICKNILTNLEMPLIAAIWLGAIYYLIRKSSDFTKPVFVVVFYVLCCIFLIKIATIDLLFWDFSYYRFIFQNTSYSYLDGMFRMINFIPIILVFAYFSWLSKGFETSNEKTNKLVNHTNFMTCAIAILFLYSTFEFNSLLAYKVPDFQYGGISILWSIFAIAFLVYGILKSSKNFRKASLILFAVVIAKVFIFDLRELSQGYKIAAFIILGLIFLVASFAYVKYKDNFEIKESDDE
ncbi:MAG: DUF2339 domain-containing protein [Kiritimatiellae bacterium]|jgi:hypothetical protein|nr:DUF2339 domain-containing protein [Kiritimatiellia bacterium]